MFPVSVTYLNGLQVRGGVQGVFKFCTLWLRGSAPAGPRCSQQEELADHQHQQTNLTSTSSIAVAASTGGGSTVFKLVLRRTAVRGRNAKSTLLNIVQGCEAKGNMFSCCALFAHDDAAEPDTEHLKGLDVSLPLVFGLGCPTSLCLTMHSTLDRELFVSAVGC